MKFRKNIDNVWVPEYQNRNQNIYIPLVRPVGNIDSEKHCDETNVLTNAHKYDEIRDHTVSYYAAAER